MQRLWEFGDCWITDRPGTTQLYRAWYDKQAGRVRYASLRTDNLEAAKRGLADFVLQESRIPEHETSEIELELVLQHYWLNYGMKLASKDSVKSAKRYWLGHFSGGALVSAVNRTSVEAMLKKWRAAGLAEGTIARYLTIGQTALNRAHEDEILRSAPYIPKVSDATEFEHTATTTELAAFLSAIEAEHLWVYTMIRIGTACRGDAALDLRAEQVDIDRCVIALNPTGRRQTKKRRPTLRLVPTLRAVLANAPGAPRYVQWQGRPVGSIKTAWRATVARAGLPEHFIPKIIRHTMATHLRAHSVPEWEAEGWLGHKATKTSDRYAKFRPDYMQHAAAATEAMFDDLRSLVPALAEIRPLEG